MPKLEQIYKMMEAQKTPYIRIYNLNKEPIFTFRETDSVENTIQQMEGLMPFISSYGKVIIEASNEAMKARSYAGSYKWTLEFDRPATAAAVGAPPAHPWQMQMPKEYMHQDIVAAQLKNITDRMDHEKELRKMEDKLKEQQNADPMKNIEKIAPAFLYLMGKPLEEVKTFAALYSGTAPAGGIAGPPANTLVMKDVDNLTSEEKKNKCQALADELAKYVSIEEMIILQGKLIDKLKANPQFMQTVFLYI